MSVVRWALFAVAGFVIACSGDDSAPCECEAGAAGAGGKIDLFSIVRLPDSGPVGECVSCLQAQCGGAMNRCANSEDCRAGLECAALGCLITGVVADEATTLRCVSECFRGNALELMSVVEMATCISSTCSTACLPDGAAGAAAAGAGQVPARDPVGSAAAPGVSGAVPRPDGGSAGVH